MYDNSASKSISSQYLVERNFLSKDQIYDNVDPGDHGAFHLGFYCLPYTQKVKNSVHTARFYMIFLFSVIVVVFQN